jgi:HlyD family secretion protein
MSKKQWPLPGLLLLIVSSLLLTACGPAAEPVAQAAAEPADKAAAPPERVVTMVQVATAKKGDIAVVYTYAGTLQAKQSVNVLPLTSGRIVSVQVNEGDPLKAGDPIAVVDSRNYVAQLKQAQSNLVQNQLNLTKMQEGTRPEQIAAAQAAVQFARNAVNDVNTITDDQRTSFVAALAQAQTALQQAQAAYDKISWAGDVGMTSQAVALQQATVAYEKAQADYYLNTHPRDSALSPMLSQLAQAELALALAKHPYTQTDFDLARAKVDQTQAAVDLAQVQLDETVIRAPFDGVVAEVNISEGNIVGPQTQVALFISKDTEALVNVEESRISQVSAGQNAAVRVTAYPNQDFPAVVTDVAPIADSNTHTFAVKVTPVDKDFLLRSGMYADLSLLAQDRQGALLVPRSAIAMANNQETVYVVQGDHTVKQQKVTTGLVDGDRIEVVSGLKNGDKVVIAGQAGLADGAAVEITNAGL